jgi:hypothetical protein
MKIEAIRYALEVIESNPKMTAKLREITDIDFRSLARAVSTKIVKDEVIGNIMQIAPTCYEIDGKLFLHGEEVSTIINGDETTAYELYDMTNEMENGDSYTFYTTSISYFKRASYLDTVKVKEFLDTL